MASIGACTAVICGLGGAAFVLHDLPKKAQPALTFASPAPVAMEGPEQSVEDGPPDQSDVVTSITEFQSLLEQASKVERGASPTASEQQTHWQSNYQIWLTKNNHLLNRCEQYMGANMTGEHLNFSFSCENLARGGEWMQKSVDAASTNRLSARKIYLSGAHSAIKKARAVLRGVDNPARGRSVLETPANIVALDKMAVNVPLTLVLPSPEEYAASQRAASSAAP